MTIRMTMLIMFGLIGFAAGGILCPPHATAQDATPPQVTQQDSTTGAGQGQRRFGGKWRERMQARRENQGGGGQSNGQTGGQAGAGNGAMSERRQAIREELMKLPPDQRKAKVEELKQQMSQDKAQNLEQKKQQFQDKWDKATPEQRSKFCSNVQQKCSDGGGKFACAVAQSKCAGQ